MTRIGGGGRKPPPKTTKLKESPKAPTTTRALAADSKKVSRKKAVTDRFEMGSPLASKLSSIAGKAGSPLKPQFSNEDIAELVKAFASVLLQTPNADRLKRARLFAHSVLKGKRLSKLFANAQEADLDEMFDLIAEQLEGSTFFAQLLDDVCEETLKQD